MVSVIYQVIFNDELDFKNELIPILKTSFEENYDELSEDTFESLIDIKYQKQIDEYKFLIGFEVIFDIIGEEIDSVINDFGDNLKDSENISLVLKFYDESSFTVLSQLYQMLYSLEMRLREVISLIFIDTYKSGYYNLLREFDLNPKYDGRNNIRKDESQRSDFLGKRFENEFFFLLFNEYTKLSRPKNLQQDELYLITEISTNFEEFKNNILKRGITTTDYINFIENIKPVMDEIHRIRNCVAHNRSLPEDDQRNYQTYFDKLNGHIDELMESLKEEDVPTS